MLKPIQFENSDFPLPLTEDIADLLDYDPNDMFCALVMSHSVPIFGVNMPIDQLANKLGLKPNAIYKRRGEWQRDGTWERVFRKIIGHLKQNQKMTNLKILGSYPKMVDSLLHRMETTKSDRTFIEMFALFKAMVDEVMADTDDADEKAASDYLATIMPPKPDIVDSGVPAPLEASSETKTPQKSDNDTLPKE